LANSFKCVKVSSVLFFCIYPMNSQVFSRNVQRKRRHRRVRGKVKGTKERPRLNVFCSLRYLYVQVIDDVANRVLASANFLALSKKKSARKAKQVVSSKQEQAAVVGKEIAQKCLKMGIKKVVFDRGGYKYHGKIKILAETMRKEGLEF